MKSKAAGKRPERSLRLKPADPFTLIRWLARSQTDPRKALAELVQNSVDAAARHVRIERLRLRGAVCLLVRDDGEGVLPEMGREEALAYIATHVGHSRKLGLDPGERARRVIAGQYGVGLLGFWAVGRFLELRSRVAGSPLLGLRLEEDSPDAVIVRLPHRLDDPDTFTEVLVRDVHPAAQRALGGRRLSDYLAAELRGQILRTGVDLTIHDRIARGVAQKRFLVTPVRYAGERLALPAEVEIAGQPPLKVELYLARGAERPAIQVAAAGTLVADDVAELAALGLAEPPWVGRDLVGILDYAGFRVPPGTRRGVLPDRAAEAFVEALAGIQPLVEQELARLDAERQTILDRDVIRDLKRALRGFRRRLPQYDLPRVAGGNAEDGNPDAGAPLAPEPADEGAEPEAAEPRLFAPGPLVSVRIVPPAIEVAPGGERRIRAVPADAEGCAPADVVFCWRLDGQTAVSVRGEGPRPAIAADPRTAVGQGGELRVEARQGERIAVATASVQVVERREEDTASLGIPEPQLVSDADGMWRSRMRGDAWEVNDTHEDYRALCAEPRARLRYLLALLAKEIVLRSSGRPEEERALESLVEILAHAERNLRGG